MNNGILIFIAFVVVSSTIAAISGWLKKQQQEEQARMARERSGARTARPDTGVDTIDRYVAEIERLRQRKAGGVPPKAAPATFDAPRPARILTPPVVKPARRPRPVDGPPVVKPVQKPRATPPRLEDLPVAPRLAVPRLAVPLQAAIVVPGGSLFPQAAEEAATARPEVSRAKLTDVPPFLALLSSPKGLATAMAISVVLGPPRCKQHHV
jgi:hypothetical protein